MEPVLRTSHVSKGRFLCVVCFDSISLKNKKRDKIHKVKNNEDFYKRAHLWTEYDHEYSTVFGKHGLPSSQELYYHHKCQPFFDDRHLQRQQKKVPENVAEQMEIDTLDDVCQQPSPGPSNVKRVTRSTDTSYQTAKDDICCIICKTIKTDSHGRKIPAHYMEMRLENKELHQAEEQLVEFANLHVSRETKYKDAAHRILLQKTIKSLFLGDVGFHNECYNNFRAPSWKKVSVVETIKTDEKLEELMNLVEYLVIGKKEIYKLSQLRKYYENGGGSTRSIDLKDKILERFSGKVSFCKPTGGDDRCTEYLLPSDSDILPKTLRAVATGEGITSCLQLKSIAQNVSDEIRSFPKSSWPPTPQAIIQSKETVSKILYNFLAWVVSPHSHIGKDGLVKLSENKATVITQICDNITALAPFSKPTLSQVLVSLSIYAKTGSKLVIDDLKRIGTGISYTETLFILDKWAEWAAEQGSIIPGNILKFIMATHIFDNIDWSRKNGRLEIHLTNSILVQRNDLVDTLANVTLDPNYEYSRKTHRSFKGTPVDLPHVSHKRSEVKLCKPKSWSNSTLNINHSSARTLVWVLARYHCAGKQLSQVVPGWSGFQQLVSEPDLCPVTVGYLPPISESPTQMRVIYAEIERTLVIMDELGLPFIFIEADQAIFTKILDAMFRLEAQKKEVFKKIIPRMGGFHILMCMLKTIFSLFKNIGFVQLLNSIGMGGMGTIKKLFKGSDVKEGIELHKKLFEALLRTKIDFALANDNSFINAVLTKDLDCLISDVNSQTLEAAERNIHIDQIPRSSGDMGKVMEIYLEMVNLMLNFIHFTRSGNWEGFLEAVHEFLPYCFRLNRNKYAKDLSFYYVHMCALKTDNPEAYTYLKEGGFSGSLTGLPHSRIPFDQIIEMTINRSCKDIGGLRQDTNNPGATERWTRTNHLMVALREHLNKKVRRQSKVSNRELGAAKIKRDENDVRAIQNCLEKWIPDLWEPNKAITHIFSGIQATEAMKNDSLDITARGAAQRDIFLKALSSEEKKQVYYGSIPRQPIKLFSTKKEKKKITIESDECQSFAEVFSLFDEKKLNLKLVLEWPVFSKPWAIVNDDLKSRDNAKSTFRNSLQSMAMVDSTHDTPRGISTSIVDGMRVVRMLRPSNVGGKTLRHWAKAFVNYVISLPGNTLHLLFDDYKYGHSIPTKNRPGVDVERDLNHLDQELPSTSEWDEFLMNSNNKFKLVTILVDFILSNECKINQTVYINKQTVCYIKESNAQPREFEQLHSTHREADQKIPMHAVFAGTSTTDGVCVVADDTDIYISLLFISSQVSSALYFRQGKVKDKNGIQYHNVHSLAQHLGPKICHILPSFHSLTGSDFTNPFFGRTKVTSFKKLQMKSLYCSKLQSMGSESVNITDVTDFILHIIYNRPLKEKTPGESRHRMIMAARKRSKSKEKKYPSSKAIPPDQSSLKMKILRANFIAHCMMNCMDNTYVPLDPAEYGWHWNSISSVWDPVWYEGNALPDESDIFIAEETEEEEADSASDADDETDDEQDSDEDSDGSDGDDDSDCVSSEEESTENEDDD